jgi:hypothetical protein
MNREPLPELVKEAEQGMVGEKSDLFLRDTATRKKRSKATSFYFAIGRREQRELLIFFLMSGFPDAQSKLY